MNFLMMDFFAIAGPELPTLSGVKFVSTDLYDWMHCINTVRANPSQPTLQNKNTGLLSPVFELLLPSVCSKVQLLVCSRAKAPVLPACECCVNYHQPCDYRHW